MRHLFGWSLPPGCGRLPGEEPVGPCECCGRDPESEPPKGCICPECPTCESVGDPECYTKHGLTLNPEQLAGRAAMEEIWRQEAENAHWRQPAERWECTCPRPYNHAPVQIVISHGSHWSGLACRECLTIVQGLTPPLEPGEGLPDWAAKILEEDSTSENKTLTA